MKPEEFEKHIAYLFENMGYNTILTKKSYDFGVDVIAYNSKEKIAIQVKMYEKRLVNYKDIMYLYAGKEYYDCNKALLITTGTCDSLANKVAEKLSVEIQDNFLIQDNNNSALDNQASDYNDFDEIWLKYIIPLKGEVIYTASGIKNTIIDVNNDGIERKSSKNEKGKSGKISKNIFKTIYYRLKENKTITRNEVNTEYVSRGSSIIVAILAKIPNISLTEKPFIKLTFLSPDLSE